MTDREKLKGIMERLAVDAGTKLPEGMQVHITKTREPCDHEWNNEGCNPTHCQKCGISIEAHAFMECP